MANPDITISYGGDEKSRTALRKEVLKSLKELSITVSDKSIISGKEKIKKSFEKSPPKIAIDVNLSSLRSARTKIQAGLSDVKIKLRVDPSDVRAKKNQIQALLGNFAIDLKGSKNITGLEKTLNKISNIKFSLNTQSLNTFLKQAQGILNRNALTARIVAPGANTVFKQAAAKPPKSPKGSQDTGVSTKSTRDATQAISTFGERLGFTTSRLVAFYIAAGALFRITQGVRSAASSIVDIDTAVNRLGQILDGNVARASKLASSVIQIAENLGQSGKQVLGIADELAQAGGVFNSDQAILSAVTAIARTPLLATFNNIEETVNGTIAALNQFNLKAEDTVRIIDLANQVSKKFAFQSQDLFTAVSRGGSTFRLVGGEIEDFIAYVAAAKELTLLPASTIGTGVNTIGLNLLKTENVEFLEQLTGGKIKDAEGNLRGLNDILIETGRALRGLKPEETVGVFRQLFDVRQTKIAGPLLLNLRDSANGDSVIEKVKEETRLSVGSSSRDAAIGLEKIESIIGSIGARFDKVFKSFGEDKGIKNLVRDFATLAKSFADTVGIIQPIIPSLIRVAVAFAAISVLRNLPGFVRGTQNIAPGIFHPGGAGAITSTSSQADPSGKGGAGGMTLRFSPSSQLTDSFQTRQRGFQMGGPINFNRNSGKDLFAPNRNTPIGFSAAFGHEKIKIQQSDQLRERARLKNISKTLDIRNNEASLKKIAITPSQFSSREKAFLQTQQDSKIQISRSSRLSKFHQDNVKSKTNLLQSLQNGPLPNSLAGQVNHALRLNGLQAEVKTSVRLLKTHNNVQKAYTDTLQNATTGLESLKQTRKDQGILERQNTLLQNGVDNNILRSERIRKIRERRSPVLAGIQAGGRSLADGFSQRSELVAGIGVGVASDLIIQSLRNEKNQGNLFSSDGGLRKDFVNILNKNNSIKQDQANIAGAGTGSSLGTITGAAIGSAAGPIGSFVGAGIGSAAGAGIGFLASKLSAKDNTLESLLELLPQGNKEDKETIFKEILKKGKIEKNKFVTSEASGGAPFSQDSALFRQTFGKARTVEDKEGRDNFINNIDSEKGLAFREQLFIKLVRGGIEDVAFEGLAKTKTEIPDGITGGVKEAFFQASAIKRLEKEGLSTEQAEAFLSTSRDEIVTLAQATKKGIEDFAKGVIDLRSNFADFVSVFEKETQRISDTQSINSFNSERNSSNFAAASGQRSGQTSLPTDFANIATRILDEKIGTSTDLNVIRSSLDTAVGSTISDSDKNIISDLFTARSLVGTGSLKIRSGLGALEGDSPEALKVVQVEQLVSKLLSPELTKRLNQAPEGKEFLEGIRGNLLNLVGDASLAGKSQEDIKNAVLGPLASLEFITNRLGVSMEGVNQKEREKFDLLNRELQVLGEATNIRRQAFDFDASNISRRESLGASSEDIISLLRSQLVESSPLDPSNVIASQDRLSRTNNIEDENSAKRDLDLTNFSFSQQLADSTDNLQILNQIFDKLTVSIKGVIESSKQIGLSSVSDRFSGERNLSTVEDRLTPLFSKGGLLAGITSPEGLITKFGDSLPSLIQKIAPGLTNDSSFLDSAGKASSLFGGTTLSGGTGQTVQQGIDIAGFIAGIGRVDKRSGTQVELSKILNLSKEQLSVFFDARSIEQKQLDTLTAINNNLITAFKIPVAPQRAPVLDLPAPAPTPQSPPSDRPAFNKDRVKNLTSSTSELLSFLNTFKQTRDGDPTQDKSIDSLRTVLKEIIADTGSATRNKNESKIDFKSDINIQGFENVGKDRATGLIMIEILDTFRKQLLSGSPSEQALAEKLGLAIRQIQSGLNE